MSNKEYVESRIRQHQALAEAVDQVTECSDRLDSDEYVVDGEAYQQMFDCFVALRAAPKVDSGSSPE